MTVIYAVETAYGSKITLVTPDRPAGVLSSPRMVANILSAGCRDRAEGETMNRAFALLLLSVCLACLTGCQDDGQTYTLYRNSPMDASMRVHVASFDSKDGADYNNENCQAAAGLYASQAKVTARFWCEK